MKYYPIRNSLETKVVGRKYPQLECNNLVYAHAIPIHGSCKKQIKLSFNLAKGAKITDVLSTFAISACGFIVSERLKELLKDFNLERHEYIPTEIISGENKYKYFFLHFFGEDMIHCLDYQRSIFRVVEWGFKDLGTKSFDSFDSLKEYIKKDKDNFLMMPLEHVVLKEVFKELDLFSIPQFANEMYVSEKLKAIIANEKITGFSFEDYFQRAKA